MEASTSQMQLKRQDCSIRMHISDRVVKVTY